MGVIEDRQGTYYAQQQVPEPLKAAVARVIGSNKPRQVFLKKSLGTKILKEANVRAKPVLAGFDQIIKQALRPRAFSSEVDTGSREENASEQESVGSDSIRTGGHLLTRSALKHRLAAGSMAAPMSAAGAAR